MTKKEFFDDAINNGWSKELLEGFIEHAGGWKAFRASLNLLNDNRGIIPHFENAEAVAPLHRFDLQIMAHMLADMPLNGATLGDIAFFLNVHDVCSAEAWKEGLRSDNLIYYALDEFAHVAWMLEERP